MPEFNYSEPAPPLEIPVAERIAKVREDRARGRARQAARMVGTGSAFRR